MLRIQNLSKKINKKTILDDISLTLNKGSISGLLGPNGSGKTTLIKTSLGVYTKDSGQVSIDGKPIDDSKYEKNKIVYIPDQLYFYENFTLQDIKNFYKKSYSNWDEKKFEKINSILNLSLKQKIGRMSKGMKAQAAILLSFSCGAEYILMDEPTSGLDPVIKEKILEIFLDEIALYNTGILISTHHLGDLERIADEIAIIKDGKLLISSGIDDLKYKYKHIQIAYLGKIPEEVIKHKNIAKVKKQGRVYQILVEQNDDSFNDVLEKHKPVLFDELNLTLEESFIYEMEKNGYCFKSLLGGGSD